jgi:hypothetical protein
MRRSSAWLRSLQPDSDDRGVQRVEGSTDPPAPQPALPPILGAPKRGHAQGGSVGGVTVRRPYGVEHANSAFAPTEMSTSAILESGVRASEPARALKGMADWARTPVLPEAIPEGALSALLRPSRFARRLGALAPRAALQDRPSERAESAGKRSLAESVDFTRVAVHRQALDGRRMP